MKRRALEQEVLAATRALGAADGLLNAAVAGALGIHPTDLQAAEALDRRGPMTIGELAREARISPGAATALVDRMERAGFAVRRPDPSSRRRVVVAPTPEAASRFAALFLPVVDAASELVSPYSDRELEAIRDFLAAAAGLLTRQSDAVRQRAGTSRSRNG